MGERVCNIYSQSQKREKWQTSLSQEECKQITRALSTAGHLNLMITLYKIVQFLYTWKCIFQEVGLNDEVIHNLVKKEIRKTNDEQMIYVSDL